MPLLVLVPVLLAAVGGTAYYVSSDEGSSFVDEVQESAKSAGRDILVSGVVLTALSVLPITKKEKIVIGSAYSAYLIAKIKSEGAKNDREWLSKT